MNKYKVFYQFDDDEPQQFASLRDGEFELTIKPTYTAENSSITFLRNGKEFRLFVASDDQLKSDLTIRQRRKKLARINDNR